MYFYLFFGENNNRLLQILYYGAIIILNFDIIERVGKPTLVLYERMIKCRQMILPAEFLIL